MSNKLKYIIFFGAIFGLLGFAHSIRCSETPIISSLVGWLTICTAVFYFALQAILTGLGKLHMTSGIDYRQAIHDNESAPALVVAAVFSVVQHVFIYVDMYWLESITAGAFFVAFFVILGKAVDG